MNLPSGARALVTGAAGFIGSHLCDHLLDAGLSVTGIDVFTDYYDPATKRGNIASAASRPGFRLVEACLREAPLEDLLADADVVYHLAAQPGVRASWGADFELYVRRNILATQKLLEALRRVPRRLVFASTSSVYGDAETLPTGEDAVRRPISPYGVTKSACEDMVRVYGRAHSLAWTTLRYFTVYGPRQRPDMAFTRLITAALGGGTFTVFGDGSQSRDFTYVADAAAATAAAGFAEGAIGEVVNIGGGRMVALREVLDLVSSFAVPAFRLEYAGSERGDAKATGADIAKARRLLGYDPATPWREGIAKQRDWVAASLDAGRKG